MADTDKNKRGWHKAYTYVCKTVCAWQTWTLSTCYVNILYILNR